MYAKLQQQEEGTFAAFPPFLSEKPFLITADSQSADERPSLRGATFAIVQCVGKLRITLLQKGSQGKFRIQVTIPAPNKPPGSRLSENVKFKIV